MGILRRNRLPLARAAACAVAAIAPRAFATDQIFDYTAFGSNFGQSQLDVLNYPSINGTYMMTSGDTHRPEMNANNNTLAEFYNNFLADYNNQPAGQKDGFAEADKINTYTINNSTTTGPRPNWIVLNEISASLWPQNPGAPSLNEHRQYVIDTATKLHNTYGYNVVTYAPFPTVGTGSGSNAPSWQALSAVSYIGIENYLSGTEVWNSGSSTSQRLAWAQAQYQASKDTYTTDGVPFDHLFLGEFMGDTAATYVDDNGVTQTTGWGRAGLASASNWDTVLTIRQDAIRNVGFLGFLGYNFGANGMNVSAAEKLQHEYWYRTKLVVPGQQPQWLSDAAWTIGDAATAVPLSWNQVLNWMGGVPNASGAVANFFRTNTDARTITLDGTYTVGTLTFNSPQPYTLSAGTGGSLVIKNGTNPATISASQAAHTIGVNLALQSTTNLNVDASSLTIAGVISGTSALNKTGTGLLVLTGNNTYTGATTLSAGNLQIGAGGTSGAIAGNITNNAALIFNRFDDISYAGVISGSGSLTKTGAGNLTLTGANTFAGKTSIVGGTLTVSADTRLGNAPTTALPDSITLNGATLAVTSATQFSSNRGITIGSANGTFNTNIASGVVVTFPGSVSGTGTLTKTGSGTLFLNGNSAGFTGKWIITSGEVNPGNLASADLGWGAAPTQFVADAITLNGAGVTGLRAGTGGSYTLHSNRGITLGANGGTLEAVNTGVTFTVASVINGAGALTIPSTNIGTVALVPEDKYTGATSVLGGKLSLQNILRSTSSVTINNATLEIAPNGSNFVRTPSITIAGAGKLDLQNNDAIFTTGITRASVEALVKSGYGTGTWNGTGITSSLAAASGGANALGVLTASDANYNAIDKQAVNPNDTLVKYTYAGDSNLDGKVTFDDFNNFLTGYSGAQPSRWFTGDFNYSGATTFDDFQAFLAGFNAYTASGVTLSPSDQAQIASINLASSAPEPGSVALIGMLGLLASRRRR